MVCRIRPRRAPVNDSPVTRKCAGNRRPASGKAARQPSGRRAAASATSCRTKQGSGCTTTRALSLRMSAAADILTKIEQPARFVECCFRIENIEVNAVQTGLDPAPDISNLVVYEYDGGGG